MAIRNPKPADGRTLPMRATDYFAGPMTDPLWRQSSDEVLLVATGVTAEEYLAGPETSILHNLIDGDLFRMPGARRPHQDLVLALARIFADYRDKHGGLVFIAPMDVELAPRVLLQPDLGYIVPGREEIYDEYVKGAPDIVVEVLSPGTRRFDLSRKSDQYARYGVRELWLVDPQAKTVTVRFGDGHSFVDSTTVAFGQPIPSNIIDIGAGTLEQFATDA